MYSILLAAHSFWRWVVLAGLIYAIYRAYKGWFTDAVFSSVDNTTRHTTATIAQIQLVLGIWLYFISPVVDYFLHHFSEALHQREIRFFGMEHSSMMILAVILITTGSMLSKRQKNSRQKFKTMAIWYTVALLVIISSVPWPFSPLISRPWFRYF